MQLEPDAFEEGSLHQANDAGADGDGQTQTDAAVQVGSDSAPDSAVPAAQDLELKG